MPLSDETAPAHFSADHTLSFGQSGTPGEFFCTPFFCAPLVRVTPGASTSHQDATGPFLRPAPTSSQAIFTAFDLNVKASNSSTRDTKDLSFLPGINNREPYRMGEVEEAIEMEHFNDHQKNLIRGGPCGADSLFLKVALARASRLLAEGRGRCRRYCG